MNATGTGAARHSVQNGGVVRHPLGSNLLVGCAAPSPERSSDPPASGRVFSINHLRLKRAWLPVLAAVFACGSVSGCSLFGYTAGGLDVPNVRTIHIPIFEMDGFRRDVEYMLTEAVQKEIKTRTSYRIADAAVADTILSGRILDVRKDVLSETQFDDPREVQLTLGIEVIWIDRRSGQILNQRTITLGPEFRQQLAHAEFAPELGHSMATAMHDAVNSLANQIADMTEVSW